MHRNRPDAMRPALALPAAFALCLALAFPAAAEQTAQAPGEFHYHQTNILGTSMELIVRVPTGPQAVAVERTVLAEVERLRLILSTYDASSEISRLATTTGPVKCSPELLEVLDVCRSWQARSGGAFNPQLGSIIALWQEAVKSAAPPDPAALAALVQQIAKPTWKIDKTAGTVTRLDGQKPNVDALAKGYIIEKAVAAARAKEPAMTGILLDIGGDIRVWSASGSPPWTLGVADPKHAQENAAPIVQVRLTDGAIATSGHYARYYMIGGKPYSHILDPRTGRPVEAVASASVVAKDVTTADALATTLCVLGPGEGLKLVKATPGAECLIIGADGKQTASDGWKALEAPAAAAPAAPATPAAAQATAWPAGYQLTINLTLPKRKNRPYVAIWIEDAAGKAVRTISVWGKKQKYIRELKTWWKIGVAQPTLVNAVSRASRAAGQYELVWDGKDDKGAAVPPGTYTVRVETARENGPNTLLGGPIPCADKPATAAIPGNNEVDAVGLSYGPPAGP